MLLFFGINLFLQLFVTKNIIFCFTLLLFQITIQILAQYKEAGEEDGGDGTRGLEQSSLVKGCPPVRWLTILYMRESNRVHREENPTPHHSQKPNSTRLKGRPYAHIHIHRHICTMQDYTFLYILLPSFSLLHKY